MSRKLLCQSCRDYFSFSPTRRVFAVRTGNCAHCGTPVDIFAYEVVDLKSHAFYSFRLKMLHASCLVARITDKARWNLSLLKLNVRDCLTWTNATYPRFFRHARLTGWRQYWMCPEDHDIHHRVVTRTRQGEFMPCVIKTKYPVKTWWASCEYTRKAYLP